MIKMQTLMYCQAFPSGTHLRRDAFRQVGPGDNAQNGLHPQLLRYRFPVRIGRATNFLSPQRRTQQRQYDLTYLIHAFSSFRNV